MKRIVFLVLSLIVFGSGFSQAQDAALGNWVIYFGNKQINERLNWHHELQYRNYNPLGDLEQLLLRTGLGYNLTQGNNNLLLGYGFIRSENYLNQEPDKAVLNEHRIYQQFITKHKAGVVSFQHRYRVEERFVEKGFRMRFRYFLSLNLPITNKDLVDKTLYLSAYNEIFLNTENTIFDRNRLYAGLGYKLSKLAKFEVGYMNQLFSQGSRDQLNLITFLSF